MITQYIGRSHLKRTNEETPSPPKKTSTRTLSMKTYFPPQKNPNMKGSHKTKKVLLSHPPTLIAEHPRRDTKSRQKIQTSRKNLSVQKGKLILTSPSRRKCTRTTHNTVKSSQNPQENLSRNNSIHPTYSPLATA